MPVEKQRSGRTTKLIIEPELTNNLIQAIRRCSSAEVVSILSLGVDINVAGVHGFTPLMAAIGCKQVEIITLLLALGADVHAVDDSGCSSLMYAARVGNSYNRHRRTGFSTRFRPQRSIKPMFENNSGTRCRLFVRRRLLVNVVSVLGKKDKKGRNPWELRRWLFSRQL